MPLRDMIAVAVIGTGSIGPRHAKSVAACPDATLICLVDPRPEARDVAQSFKVPLYHSVQHMLENCHPDAAIVCTPNSTHVTIGLDLVRAGIHVLVEKPISTDASSARRLVDAAEAAGTHLLVGHHRRFNPYMNATKRALEDGVVGKPIAVSGLWVAFKPQSYFEPPTEWRSRAGTGGPILINLIHDIDLLQYLFGPILRVHAEQSLSHRPQEVEEGAAILFKFANGVVGTFILSDACPSVHNFESGTGENPTIPVAGKDFYRIFGSEGTLSVGDMELQRYDGCVKSWTNALSPQTLDVGAEVPFDEQLRNFVQTVRGLEAPRCSGMEGLSALAVCAAVKRALATGQAVDVER